MVNGITGIKEHTREERWAVVEKLIPLWKKKFGENLLGIAVCASVARGEDIAYSDLEMDVFLKEKPSKREDQYLQRVVDGMLIEAIYHTPEEFIHERSKISSHWHLSASEKWVGVYNPSFLEDHKSRIQAVQHTKKDFLKAATFERYVLQESFCKVLNAVEMNNREGISLLLMDATMHLLHSLALINQQPFITFSRFISQARIFEVKPDRLDELLDLLVNGSYQELDQVGEICLAVFGSLEEIFRQNGIDLFNDDMDPNLPNRVTIHPI
jgi:hypothetical protein